MYRKRPYCGIAGERTTTPYQGLKATEQTQTVTLEAGDRIKASVHPPYPLPSTPRSKKCTHKSEKTQKRMREVLHVHNYL